MAAIRILIDCTATQASTLQTGIERVVRNIAAHAESAGQAIGVNCHPIKLTPTGYVLVTAQAFNARSPQLLRLRTNANRVFSLATRRLSGFAPKLVQRYLLGTRHEPSLAKLIYALLLPATRLSELLRRRVSNTTADCVVSFRPGDILLLADSVWNYTPWPAVQAAKAVGAFVATVVYDIIPVTHPQFFAPVSREKFSAALGLLIHHADAFLCISAFTEMQLQQHTKTQGGPGQPSSSAYSHFALGAELNLLESGGKTREKVTKIFANKGPIYLVVGTLEPRKNHNYLLQSFRKLWDAGIEVSLLIVGRIGWMSDALLSHIKTHPLLGQRLFFLEDTSDAELDYCYSHARAILLASVVEGFGLPLVEALHKGRPVFASDIPVFREVGGGYPVYFDLSSPDALYNALLDFETSGGFRGGNPENFTWPTWSESTSELLTKLLALRAASATP